MGGLLVNEEERTYTREYMRRWRAVPENRESIRVRDREYRFKRYGMTRESYEEMALRQGGVCILSWCSATDLVIDHDHVTGRVRGLLCRMHNGALGLIEKPEQLVEVIRYLDAVVHPLS